MRRFWLATGGHSEGKDRAAPLAHYSFVDIAWVCILAGLVSGLYLHAPGFSLWISIVMLGAMALLPKKNMRMRAVDWGVLLISALEFGNLFSSQYWANSVRTTVLITLSVLAFLVVRVTIWHPLQMVCLGGVVGLGGAWLGLSAIRQFTAETEWLASAGFSNLVAFRSQLIAPTAPWIAGEWFTVVLLALPFACAVPAYLWRRGRTCPALIAVLPLVVVTSSLALSMSRAIFLSIVLFYFFLCALLVASRVVSLRAGGTLLAGALGALILILACESAVYPGLVKAYAGQHTSQTRSTQGRFEIWSRSFTVIRAHPFWGVGSGNASLALTSSADQDETTGFASRTFSLPIQVLVEKGVIGFLTYCSFLILLAREFIRSVRNSPTVVAVIPQSGPKRRTSASAIDNNRAEETDLSVRTAMACCFAAGLVAVLFREMTYSSLFEHHLTLALVAVLSALVCSPQAGD